MPTEGADDLVLRPALHDDLDEVAGLLVAARLRAVPSMPPLRHAPDDVRAWVRGWDLARQEVWVAEAPEGAGAGLLGFANVEADWLNGLYVAPHAARSGVGSALLDLVKGIRPDGFCLWVFESNTLARGFYRRHGLIELEHTDGSANEEREPDLRMAWPGREPLSFLRGLIDDVDAALGDLLARRLALTRAVQEHKRAVTPDPRRDAAREAEIAAAVAARVPGLGAQRVHRIVHTVISESLDAVRSGQPGESGPEGPAGA